MISKMSQSGHTAYGLVEFVIDSAADINYLPLDVPMGSVAFCIENSEVYMINGSREWVKI